MNQYTENMYGGQAAQQDICDYGTYAKHPSVSICLQSAAQPNKILTLREIINELGTLVNEGKSTSVMIRDSIVAVPGPPGAKESNPAPSNIRSLLQYILNDARYTRNNLMETMKEL